MKEIPASMTKEQAFRIAIAGRTYDSFDYALPQQWVDKAANKTESDPSRLAEQFVWLYDDQAPTLGRPFPVTKWGRELLEDVEMKVLFCINCENQAVWEYQNCEGIPMSLCQTCKEAFELGQVNSEANISKIGESEDEGGDA